MSLRISMGTVALAAGLVIATAFGVGVNALTTEASSYNQARLTSSSELIETTGITARLTSAVTSARASATAAAGKVTDPAVLAALATETAAADTALKVLNTSTQTRTRVLAANDVTDTYLPWAFGTATENIRGVDTSDAVRASQRAIAALTAAQASIDNDTLQWTAITKAAAAKAAAALAASQARPAVGVTKPNIGAAAPQRKPSISTLPPLITAPPQQVSTSVIDAANAAAAAKSSPYSVTVRTLVVGGTLKADGTRENGQSALDAGGQIAIVWKGYGTEIAAHNGNDPLALKLVIGDIVNFSGAFTGSYRVTGSIDVAQNSSTDQLTQLKTQVFMQTCYWNSNLMRVVGLVPG